MSTILGKPTASTTIQIVGGGTGGASLTTTASTGVDETSDKQKDIPRATATKAESAFLRYPYALAGAFSEGVYTEF